MWDLFESFVHKVHLVDGVRAVDVCEVCLSAEAENVCDEISYELLDDAPAIAKGLVPNLVIAVGSPTTAGRSNMQSFNGFKNSCESAGRPFCSQLFTFEWATLTCSAT